MDSTNNSASLQSSSGGDEEYDSRAATFINHQQFSRQPPPPPSNQYHNTQITPPSMFDPSSSGYNFVNQNPFLNLDMLTWPKSFRSADPPPPQPQTIQAHVPGVRPSSSPPEQGTRGGSGSGVGPVRNSNAKKRSRASRRAPTTVLTTDTTNFRAMVQEFTGIPAPPFSTPTATTTSLFPRTNTTNQQRLDFFSSTPPNYRLLTRQQQPFVPTASANNNFQLPSPLVNSDLPTQVTTSNPNPMLSFQSLLQTSSSSTTTPTYSLPQFHNALSGMEAAGTSSSPSMMMMMMRRSNISYGDPRQQQQDLGAATSSSNIDHGDRGRGDQEENVASRSEGMVESWISSSD